MPAFCSVVGCSMRGERDNVKFYRIPAALQRKGDHLNELSKNRRERWIKSLKRGPLSETFLKHARICSRHFLTGTPAQLEDKDNPDWIPNQNMGYESSSSKNEEALERYARYRSRFRRKETVEESEPSSAPVEEYREENPMEGCSYQDNGVAVQTDLNLEDLKNLFDDLQFCSSTIHDLRQKLKVEELSLQSFENDDSKTLYFTGLPTYKVMLGIFNDISPYLFQKSALPPFKQFLLSFMKLRLNLPFKYLGYTFGVSPQTSSQMFYKCIDVLYSRYKKLISWPNREKLQTNVPLCFKEVFGNKVTVIIDCFEIFTERPSNYLNAAQCWSNYKHHVTVKFLIGITPQGTVSFISDAYGGRSSDKFITEDCGFLNLILPGDTVLADRGFLIRDDVEVLGAKLQIPMFTKGKNQLHPADLEKTRNIAKVRIHVERVIGLLKNKFKICQGPLPMSMLTVSCDGNEKSALDKIMVVCGALLNICASVIPLN